MTDPARTAIIVNILQRPGTDSPITSRSLTVRTFPDQSFIDGGGVEKRLTREVVSDSVTGSWSVEIEVNADMDPSGGYHTVRELGLITPFIVTGAMASTAVTGLSAAADTITQTATPLVDGQRIVFTDAGASSLVVGRVYFVVGKTTNSFQVATTEGGPAVVIATATVAYRTTTTLRAAMVVDPTNPNPLTAGVPLPVNKTPGYVATVAADGNSVEYDAPSSGTVTTVAAVSPDGSGDIPEAGLAGALHLAGLEALANKTIDGTLAGNSDTLYPSEKAVKTYVDSHAAVGLTRVVRTSAFTAARSNLEAIDTTGGTFAGAIPAASGGTGRVVLKWVAGTVAPTLTLTGTDKLNTSAGATPPTFLYLNQSFQLESDGSSIWTITATDPTLSGLDKRYPALVLAPLRNLEGVALWVFGHSFFPASNSPAGRLGQRSHMTAINHAVAGNTMAQTLANIQSYWTPDTPALVLLCSLINDSNSNNTDVEVGNAFRSCMAYLTAKVVLPYSNAGFVFGSGWTSGTTSTVNSFVDFAWSGDTAHLLLNYVTGTGGTVSIIDSGTGVTKTANSGSHSAAYTGAVALSGYGAGPHTVRIKLTSGSVTVVGAAVRGDSPAQVIQLQEGAIPAYDAAPTKQTLLTSTYRAACLAVAASFPSVTCVPADSGWLEAAMTSEDSTHPNDFGIAYYTDLMCTAANRIGFVQGLNHVNLPNGQASPTYVPATPNWVASPIAPDSPTGPSATPGNAQNVVTWTAAAANGSTVTAYKIYRSTTSGTETLFTTIGNVTTFTDTGLTNGQAYYYKVSAVNGIGEGPQSTEVTGTPALVTVPGPPTGVTATVGVAQATVAWTAPASNGGSALTGYTVSSSVGGFSKTVGGGVTTAIMVGLDGGTAYTFTVVATNAIGNSASSAASNSVTPATPTSSDKFNRANGAIGTADVGGAWAVGSGSLNVSSNAAVGATGGAQNIGLLPGPGNDMTVTAKLAVLTDANYASIVFRATDSNNFYYIQIGAAVSLNKRVTGSDSGVLGGSIGAVAGDYVQVSITGNAIVVKVNGVTALTTTDSSLTTGTKAGIRIFHNNANAWDNWSVV